MNSKTLVVAISAILGLALGTTVEAQTPAVSPLSDYVGLGTNPQADMAAFAAEEADRQASIQACMAAAGFEYVALPWDFNLIAPEPGVDTAFGLVEPLDPAKQAEPTAALKTNPNAEYAESLPDLERNEYFEVLFGANWQDPNQSASDFLVSCSGAAYAVTPGVAAEAAALRTSYRSGLSKAVGSRPAVKAATSQWMSCMAKQGYAVTSRAELLGQIEEAVAEELDNAATLSESKYSELLRMERRVYSADQECGTSLATAIQEARTEFDAQFLATHANELAGFRIDNR